MVSIPEIVCGQAWMSNGTDEIHIARVCTVFINILTITLVILLTFQVAILILIK